MAKKTARSEPLKNKTGGATWRFQPGRLGVRVVVSTVEGEMQNQGFHVFPSTEISVVKMINRGISTGVIKNREEATISAAALLAAGAQEANEEGTVRVRPLHVSRGWRERISTTGGNCPPHKCMKRSILMRISELRDDLPVFNRIVSSALEKLDI